MYRHLTIVHHALQGQLSGCDSDYDGDYDQYSCTNKSAMRGVAAFASIIWVLQVHTGTGTIYSTIYGVVHGVSITRPLLCTDSFFLLVLFEREMVC